mmetsp:Transcript_35402/g.83321  ORF Transcript_35402/g.83321 Transcript_35402/m.83321 type:complete len:230 (-) Transcript_35402:683-1372(-)
MGALRRDRRHPLVRERLGGHGPRPRHDQQGRHRHRHQGVGHHHSLRQLPSRSAPGQGEAAQRRLLRNRRRHLPRAAGVRAAEPVPPLHLDGGPQLPLGPLRRARRRPRGGQQEDPCQVPHGQDPGAGGRQGVREAPRVRPAHKSSQPGGGVPGVPGGGDHAPPDLQGRTQARDRVQGPAGAGLLRQGHVALAALHAGHLRGRVVRGARQLLGPQACRRPPLPRHAPSSP